MDLKNGLYIYGYMSSLDLVQIGTLYVERRIF